MLRFVFFDITGNIMSLLYACQRFHVFMFTAQTGTQDAVIWGNSLKVTSDKHTNSPPTQYDFHPELMLKKKKQNRTY